MREEYVDERRLWSLMAAADVVVSLRAPTMGETSGSAIRALSLGRPLVVSDVGWFAELPDAAALKVPVDERETDVLAATLELLATRDDLRAAMSAAAREHVAREHGLDHVADRYAAALEEAAGRRRRPRGGARRGRGGRGGGRHRGRLRGGSRDRGRASARPVSATEATAPRERALPLAVPAWAWLTGLVVLSALVRYALARRIVAPWIMVDELIYSELAKSVAAGEGFRIRGDAVAGAYGFVYPLLLAPAWALFDSIPAAYTAAKAINALAISLAVVPAYLLARRFVSQTGAFAVAVLTAVLPSLLYAGMLMTENAFFPLFLLAALALVCALEQPTWTRSLLLLGAIGLAFATRAQAVVFVPAVLLAPLVLAAVERRLACAAPGGGSTP